MKKNSKMLATAVSKPIDIPKSKNNYSIPKSYVDVYSHPLFGKIKRKNNETKKSDDDFMIFRIEM